MINVELLEQTMQQIKDHPEQHNQAWWFSEAVCGTSMCFAGWACALSGWRACNWSEGFASDVEKGGVVADVSIKAAELLGLDFDVANDDRGLFSASNTVDDLERMVKDMANNA